MNLRKIIREEINNDLQWIKDVEADELILSPNISFRDDDEMRKIIKDVFDYDDEEIDEDLLFNLATDQGYRWSEKHQGWWHLSERVNSKSIKESNDLQWIKDTKSDEDIAQEIVDETKIVKDENGNFRVESDFDSYPIDDFYYDYSTFLYKSNYFIDYLKSDYGIEDLNHVSRIWERYKKGMGIKISKVYPINESNDFSWVDEIPIYDFHNGEYYIDISELDDDEACEVQQTILNMGIDWKESGNKVKRLYCRTFTNKGYIIRNATLYRTTKEWDDYLRLIVPLTNKVGGEYNPITYIDGRTDLLA